MARRILTIDDDLDFLELVQQGLAMHDIEVETCDTIGRAVELLLAEPFDLVVTDLGLADEGGLALLEKLAETRPDVPVVVVTGHGDAAGAARALGAKGVLVKPVDIEALVSEIERVLSA